MADPDLASIIDVDRVAWTVSPAGPSLAVPRPDTVVVEEPLEVRLVHAGRSESVTVTMRTPTDDAALAAGFLYAEGIVTDREVIEGIDPPSSSGDQIVEVHTRVPVPIPPDARRQFLTTSSCGVCGRALLQGVYAERGGPVTSALRVHARTLAGLPRALRAAQRLFDRTGGLHAAGLFGVDGVAIVVAEDIGRHNAVDKVVGRRFLERALPASQAILQVSGRVSYEIVQKAAAAGIPVVAAVSAPSSLAVRAADRLGLTLAAFVRDDRVSLYAHPERVVDADEPTTPGSGRASPAAFPNGSADP